MPALVLGATGNVGPPVVAELVAVGERPRVLVRDGDRARELVGDTADVVSGDVTAPGVVEKAAEGMDSLFLLSPHSFGMAALQLGPRCVTYAEIATVAGNTIGTPTRVVDVTPAEVRKGLVERGTEEWEADHFAEMYDLFRAGESEFVTDTVEQVTQRPARTVEAFLDETLQPAGAAR